MMHALVPECEEALTQLDLLARSNDLPAREAARCAQLVETLQRPARVCLVGQNRSVIGALLEAIVEGHAALALETLPAALEVRYGEAVRTQATLEDGTVLDHDGAPGRGGMGQTPLFLQLDVPSTALQDMSVLVLVLEQDPSTHQQALSWAARRTEIAVWCTETFSHADAQIWSHVPQRLSHHAYLIETKPDGRDAAPKDTFTGHVKLTRAAPDRDLDCTPLFNRLNEDILEGRLADVDSMQMLLHRLGRLSDRSANGRASKAPIGLVAVQPGVAFDPLPNRAPDPVDGRYVPRDIAHVSAISAPAVGSGAGVPQIARREVSDLRLVLSEPFLFLQRSAAALADDLAWAARDDAENWPDVVFAGASACAEGLRERAQNWPEDIPELDRIRIVIDDVYDAFVLLETEAEADRATDAAALLHQVRRVFDSALFPEEGAL